LNLPDHGSLTKIRRGPSEGEGVSSSCRLGGTMKNLIFAKGCRWRRGNFPTNHLSGKQFSGPANFPRHFLKQILCGLRLEGRYKWDPRDALREAFGMEACACPPRHIPSKIPDHKFRAHFEGFGGVLRDVGHLLGTAPALGHR
jgi:hypothetical protein